MFSLTRLVRLMLVTSGYFLRRFAAIQSRAINQGPVLSPACVPLIPLGFAQFMPVLCSAKTGAIYQCLVFSSSLLSLMHVPANNFMVAIGTTAFSFWSIDKSCLFAPGRHIAASNLVVCALPIELVQCLSRAEIIMLTPHWIVPDMGSAGSEVLLWLERLHIPEVDSWRAGVAACIER